MSKPLTEKVLLLGVDGLDPKLTTKFLKKGKLPNIRKYVEQRCAKRRFEVKSAHHQQLHLHYGQH